LNKPSVKYFNSHHFNNTKKNILLFNELVNFKINKIPLVSIKLKNYYLFTTRKINDKFNKQFSFIVKIINKYEKIDYNLFLNYNIISIYNLFSKISTPIVKTNELNNVYYHHKTFYYKNGNLLKKPFLENDFEYKEFIGKNCYHNNYKLASKIDIKKKDIVKVEKNNILYLDYIYGFYNFGEFWDVIHRLLQVDSSKNYQLFHLKNNRVNNINFFFEKLNFSFPSKDKKLLTYHKNNSIYFFRFGSKWSSIVI
jgi:hypothetical protein